MWTAVSGAAPPETSKGDVSVAFFSGSAMWVGMGEKGEKMKKREKRYEG